MQLMMLFDQIFEIRINKHTNICGLYDLIQFFNKCGETKGYLFNIK